MRRLRATTTPPRPKRPSAPAPVSPSTPSSATTKTPHVQVIIKLGGSALTDKSTPHKIHAVRFEQAIASIARLHAQRIGFILVHGAGSFGHFEAAAHGVATGSASAYGVAATHAAVTGLNQMVVAALLEKGVPAVGVSPLLVPGKVRVDFICALLDRGHVPVLHGDACYTAEGRPAVLSGDALVGGLVNSFEYVKRAVFLSDVDGVLNEPPGEDGDGGGEVVKIVSVDEEGEVWLGVDVRTSVAGHDVSGGILSKVGFAGKCVAKAKGRVVGFIARVGSEEAECAMNGNLPEPWSRMMCTRIVYRVAAGNGVGDGEDWEEEDGAGAGRYGSGFSKGTSGSSSSPNPSPTKKRWLPL